jgi:hypothetical protein
MSVYGETRSGYATRTEAVSSVQAGRSGVVLAYDGLMTTYFKEIKNHLEFGPTPKSRGVVVIGR